MKQLHKVFQTKVLLSEGTIQQRFVARCTREQKTELEFRGWTSSNDAETNRKCFNSLRFFMGKRSKKDLSKSQLYLEFIVSNGNVDLCHLKMQRFFKYFRKICITTKMNRLQTDLFALNSY